MQPDPGDVNEAIVDIGSGREIFIMKRLRVRAADDPALAAHIEAIENEADAEGNPMRCTECGDIIVWEPVPWRSRRVWWKHRDGEERDHAANELEDRVE